MNKSYIVTSSGVMSLEDRYDGARLEHAVYVPPEVSKAIRGGALVVLWDGEVAVPLENTSDHTKSILRKAEEAIVPAGFNGIKVRMNGGVPEGYTKNEEVSELLLITGVAAGLVGFIFGAILASSGDGGTHYHVTVPDSNAA